MSPSDLPGRTSVAAVSQGPVGISAVDVIIAKRDGGRLTDEQIDWVVAAYTRGDVADEQMAALAMAILLNGMDAAETQPLDPGDDRLRGGARAR